MGGGTRLPPALEFTETLQYNLERGIYFGLYIDSGYLIYSIYIKQKIRWVGRADLKKINRNSVSWLISVPFSK